MIGRRAKVTQAEIERAIRAAKAEGLRIVRVVARADGYAIETATARDAGELPTQKPRLVL